MWIGGNPASAKCSIVSNETLTTNKKGKSPIHHELKNRIKTKPIAQFLSKYNHNVEKSLAMDLISIKGWCRNIKGQNIDENKPAS